MKFKVRDKRTEVEVQDLEHLMQLIRDEWGGRVVIDTIYEEEEGVPEVEQYDPYPNC